MNRAARKLVFENGRVFEGIGFGTAAHCIAEVVFNTSMVGYQEIISDPSCCAQMICMTYPLIGNYGLADDDDEGRKPFLSGLIVREYNDTPSNYRYTRTLSDSMAEHGVPGIYGVDTRAITRMIRDEGSMRAMMTSLDLPVPEALARIAQTPITRDQVRKVSCRRLWYARTSNFRYNVVVLDLGVKLNIIRCLNDRGCNVTVVPFDTGAEAVLALRPDGLVLSNGPGNPADVPQAIALVRALQGQLPIFGICMGHLVISLASGAAVEKMKFGHRGGNHPVMDLRTGKIAMTAQNHSYTVQETSLAGSGLCLTHRNLLDGGVEGVANDSQHIFSVQYHPESAPGPQDSGAVFDRFLAHMDACRIEKEAQHAQAR